MPAASSRSLPWRIVIRSCARARTISVKALRPFCRSARRSSRTADVVRARESCSECCRSWLLVRVRTGLYFTRRLASTPHDLLHLRSIGDRLLRTQDRQPALIVGGGEQHALAF